MNKKKLTIVIVICILMLSSMPASAVVILPDPTTTYDGIPFASHIDDFYTYPASLMLEFATAGSPDVTYADWDVGAGTGGLDVIIYNGPGSTNIGVGSGAFTFESAIDAPGASVSSFEGVWGIGLQANGPVTVGQVIAYLEAQFGAGTTIPVFNFDSNEPDTPGEFLSVVGIAGIIDPSDSSVQALWSLDAVNDGIFDPTAWVTVPNELVLTGDGSDTGSIRTYTIDNNRGGSSSLDYAVYAPTMDLNLYDPDHLFVVGLGFDNIGDGFEEVFLSGTFSAQTPIPEPATLVLFGSGLLGLAGIVKRRKLATNLN